MSTGKDQVNEHWYCPEGENPKDHKFIRTKIQVAETLKEVNKNGDERKHGDNVSFPAESMVKKQRENTEENWYHLISTPYMPSMLPSYWRTSKLPRSIHSEKAVKKNKKQHLWWRAETENGTTKPLCHTC